MPTTKTRGRSVTTATRGGKKLPLHEAALLPLHEVALLPLHEVALPLQEVSLLPLHEVALFSIATRGGTIAS